MLTDHQVAALDTAIRTALQRGSLDTLDLIGAGELSCVVAWEGYACKRLPPQPDAARVQAYGSLVERYVGVLGTLGVPVLPTAVRYRAYEGRHVAVIIQPRVAADALLTAVMRRSDTAAALALLAPILDHVDACVAAGVGIDAQIANWCVLEGRPTLLDVTTPMLRDATGRDELDSEVFVGLLPALIRPLVRRFLVQDILDQNFVHRRIVLDLVGNIANDGLAHLTEPFRHAVNARLAPTDAPLTLAEIEAYRRSERLTWGLLRRMFRLEHWWRRWVTRRPADHLLPSFAR